MNIASLNCWIVTEGLAGTENQCLGVADALGLKPEIKRIGLKQPWRFLSPYIGWEHSETFTPKLTPPWPDLLITSGRKSIAAARYIRRMNHGKTFIAHIQDPRFAHKVFDLIAVPEHDHARGPNVMTTLAAPNRISNAKLEKAKQHFPDFETIKTPRVAVLIGGTSKAYTMTPTIMKKLCAQLKNTEAGLMITASRRTGEENETILKQELSQTEALIWDGQGENPYHAMLAWADFILVTADSVSMLSEACTTGKPVYMIPLEGGSTRIRHLHKGLMNIGALRAFDGAFEPWQYESLRDAEKIAAEIKKALEKR